MPLSALNFWMAKSASSDCCFSSAMRRLQPAGGAAGRVELGVELIGEIGLGEGVGDRRRLAAIGRGVVDRQHIGARDAAHVEIGLELADRGARQARLPLRRPIARRLDEPAAEIERDAQKSRTPDRSGFPRAPMNSGSWVRFIVEITERAIFSDFITSTWLSIAPVSKVSSAIDADNRVLSFWLSIRMSVVAVYSGVAVTA